MYVEECVVEYTNPNRKKTGTTERALLTNPSQSQMSGAFHPSPPLWPRRSLYTAPHSCPQVGCSSSTHVIGTQRDTGLAGARWCNMSHQSLSDSNTTISIREVPGSIAPTDSILHCPNLPGMNVPRRRFSKSQKWSRCRTNLLPKSCIIS
uniref:Uncharacterized protein n=1 Tax=Mesocestoides corti TaxID=53468 RepID=A0A5K3FJC3_MESCO